LKAARSEKDFFSFCTPGSTGTPGGRITRTSRSSGTPGTAAMRSARFSPRLRLTRRAACHKQETR